MLRKINHVGIPTRDQDQSLPFRTDTMGCIIATDRLIGEKRWIELSIPGAQTGLLLVTPEGREDRVGTLFNGSFGCDDAQYTYEKLLARGVEFLGLRNRNRLRRSISRTRMATPSSYPAVSTVINGLSHISRTIG